jgi:hypothetical protein
MIPNPAALLIDAQGNPLAGGDAFGRVRVSNPHTLFDSKQLYDGQPLLFSEKTTGSATIAHQAPEPVSLMSVTALAGDSAIRQTKRYFNYQPGKSHLIYVTGSDLHQQTGCVKQMGYLDDGDGVFLEVHDDEVYLVRRSSVTGATVNSTVAQASWNLDAMDGSGPSGLTLDLTKIQCLAIDLDWLGAGSVRLGFIIQGVVRWCHVFHHANAVDTVYMATPSLPVRWQLSTDGTGAGTLKAICCSVMSEGGHEELGIRRSADRGASARSVTSTLKPVLSLRLRPGRRDEVLPEALQVMTSSGGNLWWVLSIGATFADAGAGLNWQQMPESPVDYDVTESADVTALGVVVKSGYVSADMDQLKAKLNGLLAIAADIDGNSDIWTLSALSLGGGAENVFGAMGWLELE